MVHDLNIKTAYEHYLELRVRHWSNKFLHTKTRVLQNDHYYKQMNKEDVRTAESAKPFKMTYKTLCLTFAKLQNMRHEAAMNNH